MNEGKLFEQDWKKSVPSDVWYYRFKDGTASWSGNENNNTRFQTSNICDCILFFNKLFLLELKSTKSKSIPFSMFRDNQITELTESSKYDNIISGFICNFRSVDETYFLPIDLFNEWCLSIDRKSIPIDALRNYCIRITSAKKRTRSTYNIMDFILKHIMQ